MKSVTAERYRNALEAAIAAAREAGELLRAEFHREGGPRGHGGHAEVDADAEKIIRERILHAFPAAYLGEETGAARGGDPDHIWLVDPNDGTSAYLKGWRGSAVSIALLRAGEPVLGVVYAPCYPDDNGDLIAWAEGCGPATRNGKPVTTPLADMDLQGSGQVPAVVFVSQDADKNPEANAECVAPARFIAIPSIAYRLALVAAGEGVAAVSLNGPGAWDYAGGHALLSAAGGTLIDQDGRPIGYTPEGHSSCGSCFGGAPAAVAALVQRDWQRVFSGATRTAGGAVGLVPPTRGEAVSEPGRLSRAQGCLLGQLVGDSLGGLVEFRSAASIKSEYPEELSRLADGGTWGILAGQPTDDSEMALMLARSIVQMRGYKPEAALDAYLHWYATPPFDIGNTTSAALRGARYATPQERVDGARQNANTSSQANGSLMRISPLGVLGFAAPAKAAEWARADSSLTHPHPVCQDACAVFVAAIAATIAEGLTARECYAAACAEARRSAVDQSVVDALRQAAESPPQDYQTHQGWVLIALQNAFYQLLHASDLEEGVVQTVMAGGDTDTNAAIAGALLGAVHGREAVPHQWLTSVLTCRPLAESGTSHPRPIEFWPVDVLRLAEKLLILGA